MSLFELDLDTDVMNDRHDPKQIRARQFARVRKGFDPEQVRVFLDEVATQMEQLQSELRFAQEEGEAASRRAGPDPYTQLGAHVAELVRDAEEHAERIRGEANQEAERVIGEAGRQAEQAKQEANEEIGRARQEIERQVAAARAALESESRQIAEFGHQRHAGDERHAAQGLQGRDDGSPPPRRREVTQLLGEPRDPSLGLVDRVAVFLQRDMLRGGRKTEIR